MKKLLSIGGDIFLFSLLLIILALPLLVSLNLDPKIKKIDVPVVAGVADSTVTKPIVPNIEENFTVTDNITILSTDSDNNKYTLRFEINGLGKKESSLHIGQLSNNENEALNYNVKLIADKKNLSSSKVLIRIGKDEKYLFYGDEFEEANIELGAREEQPFEIIIQPANPISYPIKAMVELRVKKES